MSNPFFDHPILNSPYECPQQHWELDPQGQPTQQVIRDRRRAEFITPIPKPKKRKRASAQEEIVFDEGKGLSTKQQQYDPTSIINEVRGYVDSWRSLPHPNQWQVTPETVRLLQHWRHHQFDNFRPFFCQVEAVETVIWLTEVAPQSKNGKRLLDHLAAANKDANPELMRLALKLATGAGKTTVMAMLIAWQTINAVRRPASKHFTRGFLVCAPGLTIKDRLRVLHPNDPDSYYASRELVPHDMLDDVNRAKIVITNYHVFKLRERIELSAGGRSLLIGRTGDELNTTEAEGQMVQRVTPNLMGMKDILVINDEAHHCYREKPEDADDEDLKGDEKKEAEKNNEAARLWISGLEAVKRKLGLSRVIDLSATPFFLRGSGYAEGTLFPWTMSDFSLSFNDDSILELSPDLVGPTKNRNEGIIGEGVDLTVEHLGDMRPSTLLFHVTRRLLYTKWRDPGEEPKLHLFGQLKRITKQWLDTCLVCKGGTYPAQLMYQELSDMACNRITAGITRALEGKRPIKALLDPYNPTGSTAHVRFNTSRTDRWETSSKSCHINWVVLDSDWEAEFCRVAESHPKVRAYVKNHNLGLEVPYRYRSEIRKYLPDFIVLVDDGHGPDDLLHLVVEIKGYRREDAKEKKSTMETYWVPGVNNLTQYGRCAFSEFTEVYQIETDFAAKVESEFAKMIETAVSPQPAQPK